jgi:hypothetical protein
MRKLLIAATVVAATAAVPTSAGATETGVPGTCDLVKNTICHLIPPTSVSDVCEIVDATTNLSCTVSGSRT